MVEIGGRQLRGEELTLVVRSPDDQDVVRMEIRADHEHGLSDAAVYRDAVDCRQGGAEAVRRDESAGGHVAADAAGAAYSLGDRRAIAARLAAGSRSGVNGSPDGEPAARFQRQ